MTVLCLWQKHAATVVHFQIHKLRRIKRRRKVLYVHTSGFCFGLVLCGEKWGLLFVELCFCCVKCDVLFAERVLLGGLCFCCVVKEWPAGKQLQRSSFSFNETANYRISYWTPIAQSPVKLGFHCQARYDHHPQRQCSLLNMVSSSSLTMEVEVVTQAHRQFASRRNSRIMHAIVFTDLVSCLLHIPSSSQIQCEWAACFTKVQWKIQAGMCWCSTSTQFKDSHGYTVLDILDDGVKGNDRADDWQAII